MKQYLKTFATDEDGAITVDWVVLTAAMVALALLIISIMQTGSVTAIQTMWTDVDTEIAKIKSP